MADVKLRLKNAPAGVASFTWNLFVAGQGLSSRRDPAGQDSLMPFNLAPTPDRPLWMGDIKLYRQNGAFLTWYQTWNPDMANFIRSFRDVPVTAPGVWEFDVTTGGFYPAAPAPPPIEPPPIVIVPIVIPPIITPPAKPSWRALLVPGLAVGVVAALALLGRDRS